MNLRGAIGGLGKGIADMGKTGFESEIMRMREENLARFRAQLQEESAVSQHGRTLERDTIQHDRTLESATVAHERGGFWSQTLGREVTREELGGMNPEQIKELDIRDKAPGHTPPDTTKYTGKYTDIEGDEWVYNPANPDDRIKLGKGPYSAGGVRASTPGSGAGSGASSGANHTAVNSAVKASQELINEYHPGKKLTPDQRKQFDALLSVVNESRATADLKPFTTDIAENQRIWRQDQHVLQGYNTTGTTPDPSGGEPQEPPPGGTGGTPGTDKRPRLETFDVPGPAATPAPGQPPPIIGDKGGDTRTPEEAVSAGGGEPQTLPEVTPKTPLFGRTAPRIGATEAVAATTDPRFTGDENRTAASTADTLGAITEVPGGIIESARQGLADNNQRLRDNRETAKIAQQVRVYLANNQGLPPRVRQQLSGILTKLNRNQELTPEEQAILNQIAE